MDKKSSSSSADLDQKFGKKSKSPVDVLQEAGVNSKPYQFDFNFDRYHLDLNFRQLRIIQLSLVYFDSLNRGSMCQSYLDDLFYTLRQVDRLICEDVK